MSTLSDVLRFGHTYATGTVTLATGATETTVYHPGFPPNAHVDLEPTNAAMAAEWVTTRPYVTASDKTKDQFTITHANALTERTVSYAFRTPGV